MIPLGPVVVKTQVSAQRSTVWAFLTRADLRGEWWPELRLDARYGGSVSERWSEGEGDEFVSRDASGEVDVAVDGHALGFRWKDADDARSTAVLITLRSSGDGTAVTVSEMGFDALSDAADRAASSHEGWRVLLADLAAVAEASGDEIPEAPPEPEPVPEQEPDSEIEPEVVAETDPSAEQDPESEAGHRAEEPDDAQDPEPAGEQDPEPEAGSADEDVTEAEQVQDQELASEPDPDADAESLDAEVSDDTVVVERIQMTESGAATTEDADTEAADPEGADPERADAERTDPEHTTSASADRAEHDDSELTDDEAEADFDRLLRGE